MHLEVRAPAIEVRRLPSLFLLMLSACAEQRGEGLARASVATLDDFPAQLDLALALVEAVNQIRDASVRVNGRPVGNLGQFWSALSCYRESLVEADHRAYCRRRAGRVGEADGCPDRTCMTHCPFICARCFQLVETGEGPPGAERLRLLAIEAEVEWCPNLRVGCSTAP